MGIWAAQPPGDGRLASVVFRKDLTDAQIRDRLTATGAAILWQDAALSLAVVDMPAGGAWRLYGQERFAGRGRGPARGLPGMAQNLILHDRQFFAETGPSVKVCLIGSLCVIG